MTNRAGYFSIARSQAGKLQGQAIADRITAFERHGMNWTYWNFRETTGPDSMALQAQKKTGGDFPINQPLLNALKTGWATKINNPSTEIDNSRERMSNRFRRYLYPF